MEKPGKQVLIFGSEFCSPRSLDLTISDNVVKDMEGNRVFEVKIPWFGLHTKRILLDSSGSTIATMKMKMTSKHDRWQVFRGQSSEADDMIFTVKRPSMVQLKTRTDVFMKTKKKKAEEAKSQAVRVCDFTVKGRFMKRACLVYAGDSDRIIAQIHESEKGLMLTVYPNIDSAFIVTLVSIFDLINMSGSTSSTDK